MRDFRELKIWGKAHQFTLEVYGISQTFPDDERFGLTAQLRRAAASIPTNIAEGCG
ncbi:MAG: four helix bundle protein [Desulfurivibrionaceae bacterium]